MLCSRLRGNRFHLRDKYRLTGKCYAGSHFISYFSLVIEYSRGSRADSKKRHPFTTTSTQDSGLLGVLVPLFEKQTGYSVKTVSVGTGQALALAAKGDADVALVQMPSLEKQYVAEGKLLNRRLVMYNDFVIIGPKKTLQKYLIEKRKRRTQRNRAKEGQFRLMR